jgi:hypothetical protein
MALTAIRIREAIAKRWAAPEYAVMWEVGRATGVVSNQRYADAVIMSLWPSRGLELHGVEIKDTSDSVLVMGRSAPEEDK